jgi:hypothetical protein
MKQRAMGEFTVAQEGESWIVLEDGRRVGGTLRYPFPSREAAQRYVERELAGEAEIMAKGNLALSAKARAIRETDAELWALFVNIEEEFAGEDEATKEAAHRAAGTFGVMIRLVMADLEADGKNLPYRGKCAMRSQCSPSATCKEIIVGSDLPTQTKIGLRAGPTTQASLCRSWKRLPTGWRPNR